jgi:hypothetical protein
MQRETMVSPKAVWKDVGGGAARKLKPTMDSATADAQLPERMRRKTNNLEISLQATYMQLSILVLYDRYKWAMHF